MAKANPRRHLAAILAADVVGYSILMGEDEEGTLAALTSHSNDFIEPCITEHQGRLVKTTGDGFLVEFASVVDAVRCAVAFQEGMRSRNEDIPENKRLVFRIGVNLGDVIAQDGDVFGDGVNVAARLEGLAEPGGICISRSARDQIRDKLDFGLEDWGEVEVKNIPRPVRVFKVLPDPQDAGKVVAKKPETKLLSRPLAIVMLLVLLAVIGGAIWWQPWTSDVEAASVDKMAFPLPDRPSIAILPFTNMSDDKNQEYFADGISEDIITDISKVSGIFVVARNSTFTYKGKPVKLRQVAEDFGVRYVLEGSVRRAGSKLRITARLTDAVKGDHLWADRYDREVNDVFAVQSEITGRVVKALAVTLKAKEHERLFQKYTANIDAYDVFLQARRTVDVPSRDNILRGEKLFAQVIELDPNFAGGYAGLSFNLSVQVRFRYSKSPATDLARAFDLARKAVELDRNFAWGHIALGGAHLAKGDADAAVNAVRHALILEPSGYEANLFMGFYLQFAGQAALAVEHLLLAKRLSPVETYRDLAFLALAQFMNRNYAEVVRIWKESSLKSRGTTDLTLAAAYALLDRPQEATAVVNDFLKARPNFNMSQFKYINSWKLEENRRRLYNAAIKAGIPEFPDGG